MPSFHFFFHPPWISESSFFILVGGIIVACAVFFLLRREGGFFAAGIGLVIIGVGWLVHHSEPTYDSPEWMDMVLSHIRETHVYYCGVDAKRGPFICVQWRPDSAFGEKRSDGTFGPAPSYTPDTSGDYVYVGDEDKLTAVRKAIADTYGPGLEQPAVIGAHGGPLP
jgi:hypothetical protein